LEQQISVLRYLLKVSFGVALFWFAFSGCKEQKVSKSGAELFQTYCVSCHSQVSPNLLPKSVWQETVLPRMGAFLGQYGNEVKASFIEQNEGGQLVEDAKIYPQEKLISDDNWKMLKEYIISLAPDTLVVKEDIVGSTWGVEISLPDLKMSPPSTTLLKTINNQLWIGDAHTKSVYIEENGTIISQAKIGEGIIDVIPYENGYFVLSMGSFSPTDAPLGKLTLLPNQGKPLVLASGLHRPVSIDTSDFDKDGDLDFVIAEFGKWTGGLTLLINENGQLRKQKIDMQSGCTTVKFVDLNNDGKKDILALFAQGNERIVGYLNQKDAFQPIEILKFPPSYGSSFMNLVDWNEDGKLDILYCAGDNADYSPILKPYHGIYLFLDVSTTEGNPEFRKEWFIPYNGAYGAIVKDLDEDGDKDVAAISFFPDYKSEEQSFLIAENKEGNFEKSYPMTNQLGRWIVMRDLGDEIGLGSLIMEVPGQEELVENWINQGISYVKVKPFKRAENN